MVSTTWQVLVVPKSLIAGFGSAKGRFDIGTKWSAPSGWHQVVYLVAGRQVFGGARLKWTKPRQCYTTDVNGSNYESAAFASTSCNVFTVEWEDECENSVTAEDFEKCSQVRDIK